MRVTQRDIARLAKVSQATVSRVLSGDPRVEPDLREVVERVITEQNYQPDVRAQSLRTKRTGLIGLVIKRPAGGVGSDPFFADLIALIVEELAETDFHLCVDVAKDPRKHSSIYDEMLRSRRVDGLFLVESEASDERITRLQNEGFPFVLIGNPLHAGQIHSIDNDNVLAGEMVTKHLLEMGYSRIAFLGARPGVTVSDDRIAGYQRALRGVQEEHLIFHADFGSKAARQEALHMLRTKHRPDAVVVLDDYMALGVSSAARDCGLSIPDDLGIVSFNDSHLCEVIGGGLTSVNLNLRTLVSHAVNRLLSICNGDEQSSNRRVIVPCSLTVRQSSQRPEVLR